MHIIAENSEYYLTEDENEWIIKEKNGDIIINSKLKSESPQYPLALVFKWGYKPVDIEFLNKLSETV